MKLAFIALALVAALILAGCTSQPPQAAPEKNAPDAPQYVGNDQLPPDVIVQAPEEKPKDVPVVKNNTAPDVGVKEFCPGKTGPDLVECTYVQAAGARNVSICTSLPTKQDRFDCIARWCGSSARDFKQCESMKDPDDRLGCLNKCNPNSNI